MATERVYHSTYFLTSDLYKVTSYHACSFPHWDPLNYTLPNSHRRKTPYAYYVPFIDNAVYRSYTKLSIDCCPIVVHWVALLFVTCTLSVYYFTIGVAHQYINSYRRQIFGNYYKPYISDGKKKLYNCYPYVSYFIVLNFIMSVPYQCAYPNSHRRKACLSCNILYIVDADYKSYIGMFCNCSLKVPYWKILHFRIPKHSKYPTKRYIYNVMMYFSECLNVFIIILNLENQAVFVKLLTLPCDMYIHG